jgi:DNA-binding FadR family transcriptional regulator
MERLGLVAQLEAELERRISLGLVPQGGRLPSERTLASKYGVSRATAREALVRLRARGLVQVQHGRVARAVVMEEAVRLENLGVALLGEGPSHPERQQLLAGYLELKREVTVELLAACCEKASEQELERVRSACFLLGSAVCWELQRPRWLAMEFELLRQATLAAQRPGHFLLIQTLERACRGMAGRVEPYLDSSALYQWTQCAMEVLESKDVKALRCRLLALLQASDERVLQALVPTCEAHGVGSLMGAYRQEPEVEVVAHPSLARVPEVSEPAEARLTTSQVAAESKPAEALITASQVVAESEPAEALLSTPQAPVAGELAETSFSSAQAPEVGQLAPEPMQAGGPGALCANWSGHHTSFPPGKPDPRGMKRGSLPVALAQRPARQWCSASPYTSLTRSPVSTPNCRHAARCRCGASTHSRLPRHGLPANAANLWRRAWKYSIPSAQGWMFTRTVSWPVRAVPRKAVCSGR